MGYKIRQCVYSKCDVGVNWHKATELNEEILLQLADDIVTMLYACNETKVPIGSTLCLSSIYVVYENFRSASYQYLRGAIHRHSLCVTALRKSEIHTRCFSVQAASYLPFLCNATRTDLESAPQGHLFIFSLPRKGDFALRNSCSRLSAVSVKILLFVGFYGNFTN